MKKTCLMALLLALSLLAGLMPALAEEGAVTWKDAGGGLIMEDAGGEDPAAGYIRAAFYPGEVAKQPRLIGEELTGLDLTIYRLLKPMIAQVAAGDATSTVFSLAVEDVYPQLTFTAEELGVDACVVNGAFSEDAWTALQQITHGFNATAIIRSLQADCPYELYWYDKTEGCSYAYPGVSATTYTCTITGTVSFSFTVAQEYQGAEYAVDPAWGQSVQSAVETAGALVTRYAGLSDYARLLACKNAICDLTSYNDDAAANDPPYGNPWQLVWVFDGNEDTTVVCEGYAKAFQYLNDRSASGVRVICASGSMDGGRHMWNIVTMRDGERYLVDVTNCDTGTVGYPEQLFLVGAVSGTVADGFDFFTESGEIHYDYDTVRIFPDSELTIASHNYTGTEPEAPDVTFSSSQGYVGYQLAVKVDGPADSIRVQETGETWQCTGGVALIPLTQAGSLSLSICAVKNGEATAYANPVTVTVEELDGTSLTLPADTAAIEAQAFQGTAAQVVVIPEGVTSIAANAFAGMTGLRVVEISTPPQNPAPFGENVVYAVEDPAAGFASGLPFVVR